MATVMTMIATPEFAGLSTVPIQPANPMVVLMMNPRTPMMASVPRAERRSATVTTTMTRSTIGAKVIRSFLVASAKARFITTSPLR